MAAKSTAHGSQPAFSVSLKDSKSSNSTPAQSVNPSTGKQLPECGVGSLSYSSAPTRVSAQSTTSSFFGMPASGETPHNGSSGVYKSTPAATPTATSVGVTTGWVYAPFPLSTANVPASGALRNISSKTSNTPSGGASLPATSNTSQTQLTSEPHRTFIESLNETLAGARELKFSTKSDADFLQHFQTRNQAITHDNDLLRRKAQAALQFARSQENNWLAIERLLNQSGLLPYTQLIAAVNRFNDDITATAHFLAENVVCRSPEAFQEELDRAIADVQTLLGPRLSGVLTSQAQEAENGTQKPHSRLALILMQIVVVAFSVLGIKKVYFHSENKDKINSVADVISTESFKISVLRTLSSILKTASWALPMKHNRIAFETLIEVLFESRENLRIAIESTFAETDVEIVIFDHGVSFSSHGMVDAFAPPSVNGQAEPPVSDDIVGTVGVGLRKVAPKASIPTDLVLRARVVLESTFQGALNGERDKAIADFPEIVLNQDQTGDGRA